ncbi:penicillin-binding protein 2 [Patescibacteria group bacterium]|nr:penicillin-binding protein 2 [Patescibacteria group bacterium]
MKKSSFLFRIKFLYAGLFLFFFILVGQLYMIQIVKGDEYSEKADNQYIKPQYIFNRGNIYFEDKNGKRISAAMTRSGFQLTINPSLIEDAEGTFNKLSQIIEIDKEDFMYRAGKKDDTYEVIKRQIIDDKISKQIKDLKLKGVTLELDKWRFYPGDKLASHVLGFVGYNEDSLEGIYGVEKYYNYILNRESKNLFVNFFAEIFLNVNSVIDGDDSKKEGDIVLTIEPTVQEYLETTLEDLEEKWSTDLAGGIIIDPNNGEIIAMGFSPSFDPNNFSKAKDGVLFGNPMVESVYEMGSIIKALTMAIGLDTGVVTAETTYNDTGFKTLNGKTFYNYDGKARGVVPMQEVLNQSLNIGAAFVENKIGNERFAKYLLDLGIGEETGIDLPNETYGLVSNLESTRDIEYATASFGQGIAMTPIETVKALSALANGGVLITPHLVKEIKYSVLSSDEISYDDNERIFKEETSDEISRMLVQVVDEALLGGTVKSEDYTIAAKTGTAQMAKEDGRGYYDDKYLHSFFGYFPATRPEFLTFLYVVDPKNVNYASHTLTQPFMDIFKFLVNYYEVVPDRVGVESL